MKLALAFPYFRADSMKGFFSPVVCIARLVLLSCVLALATPVSAAARFFCASVCGVAAFFLQFVFDAFFLGAGASALAAAFSTLFFRVVVVVVFFFRCPGAIAGIFFS